MGFGQDLTESQVCFTELDSGQQTGLSVSLLDSINALSQIVKVRKFKYSLSYIREQQIVQKA